MSKKKNDNYFFKTAVILIIAIALIYISAIYGKSFLLFIEGLFATLLTGILAIAILLVILVGAFYLIKTTVSIDLVKISIHIVTLIVLQKVDGQNYLHMVFYRFW